MTWRNETIALARDSFVEGRGSVFPCLRKASGLYCLRQTEHEGLLCLRSLHVSMKSSAFLVAVEIFNQFRSMKYFPPVTGTWLLMAITGGIPCAFLVLRGALKAAVLRNDLVKNNLREEAGSVGKISSWPPHMDYFPEGVKALWRIGC